MFCASVSLPRSKQCSTTTLRMCWWTASPCLSTCGIPQDRRITSEFQSFIHVSGSVRCSTHSFVPNAKLTLSLSLHPVVFVRFPTLRPTSSSSASLSSALPVSRVSRTCSPFRSTSVASDARKLTFLFSLSFLHLRRPLEVVPRSQPSCSRNS